MSRALSRQNIIFIFLILIGLISPVYADEETSGNESDNEPIGEIVVTAESITDDTIVDKPTSFSEIIDIAKENNRFVELRELLSDIVGIHVRSFGGPGSSSSANIRGVSSKGVLVMIDDVPLNGLGSTGVDLSSLPLIGFERIEIFRGGGGAFYGDSALGGAVNLVTSDSGEDIKHLSLSVGSFGLIGAKSIFTSKRNNEKFLLALESSGSRGDFRFLNNNGTSLDESDDFDDRRENNESESYGGLFKHTIESNNKTSISVVGEFFHSRKGIPGLLTFPTPDARQLDNRVFVQTFMERHEILPRTKGSLRMFFRHNGLDYEDKSGQGTGAPIDTHSVDNLFGIAADIAMVDPDGFGLTETGFEISDERYDLSENVSSGRSRCSLSCQRERTSRDSRLTAHGGIRIDAIEGFDPQPTFRLGASYKSSKCLEIKSNIGSSFRTPGFDELYDQRGLIIGNNNLVPEKGYDVDFGCIYKNGCSRIECSVFHNRLKNQIIYELISGHRYKPFNVGRSNLSGMELSAEWIFDKITLSGNYMYLDARNKGDDPLIRNKQLPSRPRHELFLNAEYDLAPWSFSVDTSFSSGNYVTFANTASLRNRMFVDLRIGYRDDDWSITGEIRNLLDRDNVDIRGFPLPGRFFILTFSHNI